jgi:hypothetical protein
MFDLNFYKTVCSISAYVADDIRVEYGTSHENILNARKKISTQTNINMIGRDIDYIKNNFAEYMIDHLKYFDLYNQFQYKCNKFETNNMYRKGQVK